MRWARSAFLCTFSLACGVPDELVLERHQTTFLVSSEHLFALQLGRERSAVRVVWARTAGDPVVVEDIEGIETEALYLPGDAYCAHASLAATTAILGIKIVTRNVGPLPPLCRFPDLSVPCTIACDGTSWQLLGD
jgi:hypothetical protein